MPDTNETMRESILEATISWQLMHPYQEPQLTQLAAVVGVSGRTVSRYFPCKEDLLGLAAIRYLARRNTEFAETLDGLEDNGQTAAQQIRGFFCAQRIVIRDNPALVRVFASANMRCVDYALRHQLSSIPTSDKLMASLGRLLDKGKLDGSIRQDLDCKLTIELLATGFNGLMHRIAMTCTSESTEEERAEAALLYKEFMKMVEWYITRMA